MMERTTEVLKNKIQPQQKYDSKQIKWMWLLPITVADDLFSWEIINKDISNSILIAAEWKAHK